MADKVKNLTKVPMARLGPIIGGLALLGGGLYFANNCFYSVEAGHKAIVFSRFSGIKPTIYGEGLKFKIPWLEREIMYHVRALNKQFACHTGSKDLQMVDITVGVMYKPNIDKLPDIYRKLGMDYAERVLPSIATEVAKSVVAQFTASELITNRFIVSSKISSRLVERSREFGIELENVAITHLSFGREYSQAIEAKQVAQQEAERAKFIVDRARETKREIIAKAEGDKRAAQKFNEAVRNDPQGNFLTLRKIEAAQEIAEFVARGNNKVYLDANGLLFNQLLQSANAI